MSELKLVVLLDRDKKSAIDSVADELSKAGLKVERKMTTTGIISGSAAEEKVAELRKVKGVRELREETVITLPPMDEKIPQ